MANVTNVTQLLPTANEGYVDNLSASISSEAATVPVNSAAAYQDGDVVVLVVDPGTPEEATFTGTKASSPDRFVNCEWTEGNIGAGHASGAAVVDYISATHYNLLAKALKGILNQDGSYKSSVLEDKLSVNKRTEELYGDFLVQAPITDTTGLSQTYGEVVGYIGGARVKADSGLVKVLTATSDNYVSFDNTGAINVTSLAIGSAQPALPANSLWLGKYTTNASSITASTTDLQVKGPVSILQYVYPVGSIYINATNSTNPATLLGFGTWVAFGAGRVPVGFNSGDTDYNAAEKTGGSKTHTHEVAVSTAFASSAPYGMSASSFENRVQQLGNNINSKTISTVTRYAPGASSNSSVERWVQETAPRDNTPPYITVYMWKRTA